MKLRTLSLLTIIAMSFGCAFHSTATNWNGRVGPNGKPVYVKSTTNVGFNLAIIIGLLGSTDIHTMVEETTSEIAEEGGDTVRIIQSATENYWYGFPPFTWVITPVITTVAAEYEPTAEQLAEDKKAREMEDD